MILNNQHYMHVFIVDIAKINDFIDFYNADLCL